MTATTTGEFDFDCLPDLGAGDSLKWQRYAGRDVLPLWVADMDFPAPPAIVTALQKRVARASFGYAVTPERLTAVVRQYLLHSHDWPIADDWLVWLPGLVSGLNLACRAVEGDVFSAVPVYPPFLSAPGLAGRNLLTQSLVRQPGGWHWDFPAVSATLSAHPASRLFLLCHPHNPLGRAWHDEELQEIAALAERHDLVVCSDEIHCDLMIDRARRHRPFATLSASAARRSITLMAPSKTYNMAGLGCAFAVIPDAVLRQRFRAAMRGIVPHVNALGLAAAEAAYGDASAARWHAELLDYLRDNHAQLRAAVAQMPGLHMTPVEATYLAWIDATEFCRRQGIRQPQHFFAAAGVGLSAGAEFALPVTGAGGHQENPAQYFLRLNFACPRSQLRRALARMQTAMSPPA